MFKAFWERVWDHFQDSEGGELDWEAFVEIGTDCGLLVGEAYDPEGKHKDMSIWGDVDAGDLIYVASSEAQPTPPITADALHAFLAPGVTTWTMTSRDLGRLAVWINERHP